MCRLMAIPPQATKKEALSILKNMLGGNTDGTGFAYVKDGKFVLNKWKVSSDKVVRRRYDFLNHLPHDGWTIVHQRAASHGHVCKANAHPFIIDDKWAFCHNGVWLDYGLPKVIFQKDYKFSSDTDSEVAGKLFSFLGPIKFHNVMEDSGVYLALNLQGELYVSKTSGQLEYNVNKDGTILLSSDLDYEVYEDAEIAPRGLYKFGSNGKLIGYISQNGQRSSKMPVNTYNTGGFSSKLPVHYQQQEFSPHRFASEIHSNGRSTWVENHID